MNLAIKALEEIGQNNSIKQYDNIEEMLTNMKMKQDSFDHIKLSGKDFVCVLIPEDDGEEEEKD